jgi:hypothetical protein
MGRSRWGRVYGCTVNGPVARQCSRDDRGVTRRGRTLKIGAGPDLLLLPLSHGLGRSGREITIALLHGAGNP